MITQQQQIAVHDAVLIAGYHQAIESAEARWTSEPSNLLHPAASSAPSVSAAHSLLLDELNKLPLQTHGLKNRSDDDISFFADIRERLTAFFDRILPDTSRREELFELVYESGKGLYSGIAVGTSPHRELLEEAVEPIKSTFGLDELLQKYVVHRLTSDVMRELDAAPTSIVFGNNAAEEALADVVRDSRDVQRKAVGSLLEDAANHTGKFWVDGLLPNWFYHHTTGK